MTSLDARRAAFRDLHREGCFILPNPWDVGSARYLAAQGFKALATTSSGFAFTHGRQDGAMELDAVLAHVATLVAATDLPVNADFEDGHAPDAEGVAASVGRCIATGVAGLSIEDSTGRSDEPLYPLEEAVQRLRAARRAIDAAGGEVLLVGRAECFLTGHHDPLAEALRRLTAYAEAGADCLYAPGLGSLDEMEAVVRAIAPKPVNVLIGGTVPFELADLARLGVRRVSVGGALAGAAWGGVAKAVSTLKQGSFAGFADNLSHREVNALFASPL